MPCCLTGRKPGCSAAWPCLPTHLWFFHQPLAIADAYTATSLHIFGMYWLVFVVSDGVLVWFILQVTKAVRERDAALARAREQAIRNDWLVAMGSLAAGAARVEYAAQGDECRA